MNLVKVNPELAGNKTKKEIFSGIKHRDSKAFVRAYDIYVDQIYRFVYFKVGSADEAQDLTSAVFLKAWNYICQNSARDYKSLGGLLYKIARTTIIDYYRKNKDNSRISIDNLENKIDIKDISYDIIKDAEVQSDFKLIEQKLKSLKSEYREIIILKYIDELTIAEIAEALEKSKTNVRVLAHRAIKALKELVEEKEDKVQKS